MAGERVRTWVSRRFALVTPAPLTCPLWVCENIIQVRFLFSVSRMARTSCRRGSLMPSTTSTLPDSLGTIVAPAYGRWSASGHHSHVALSVTATHRLVLGVGEASPGTALDLDGIVLVGRERLDGVWGERCTALPDAPWVFASDAEGGEGAGVEEGRLWQATYK